MVCMLASLFQLRENGRADDLRQTLEWLAEVVNTHLEVAD